jgi:nucleoside-diphosphate-sugar epimerase
MRAVAITGASGFLGRALVSSLSEAGLRVIAIVRGDRGAALVRGRSAAVAVATLGDDPPALLFEGVDGVIHAAHDLRPGSFERNVQGTRLFAEAARRSGVGRQLFLSSYSAHPQATTEYGRTKFALEQFFLENEGLVVRPGLVVGPGGLFGRILSLLRRVPLVPLPDGGVQSLPVVGLRDFLAATQVFLEGPPSKPIDLFHPVQPTLKEVVACSLRLLDRRPPVFAIPSRPVLGFLRFLEALRIPLPVRSENLEGLLTNQSLSRETSLSRFVSSPLGLEEMLRDALASASS